MALNLKVTDVNHKRIDFSTSLLRSLIVIIPSLLIIPVQFMAYSNPDLMNLEGFWTYTKEVAETYPNLTTFNSFYSTIFIVDLIMLLADGTKQNRSLKDRIAKTLVLKT